MVFYTHRVFNAIVLGWRSDTFSHRRPTLLQGLLTARYLGQGLSFQEHQFRRAQIYSC